MANTTPSINMNLPVPVVGVDPGPQYATDLNSCLTVLDAHNHSFGSGVQITPLGININADFPQNNNNILSIRSLRFQIQPSPLALASDLGCLYESGVDLYYNDGSGNQVRITQSGGIAGSPGSIANLTSPASASYVSGSATFVWQSAVNTAANLDAGSIVLRNATASSKGLTLAPPSAMASNYSLVLPALPGSQSFMAVDASGNMSATVATSLGITAANIANATITGAKLVNNTITATQIANNTITPTQLAAPIGNQQTFTSNGTYTVPAGATLILIQAAGGGGGGGNGGASYGSAGGGGAGCGFGEKIVAVTAGATHAVTIGAGGAAGSSGSSTSVGSLLTVRGGSGGYTAATGPAFSALGAVGNFAVTSPSSTGGGAGGYGGNWAGQTYGTAGGSYLGNIGGAQGVGSIGGGGGGGAGAGAGGATGGQVNNAGPAAAANSAAGGGGGGDTSASSDFAGGAGGSGLVIITVIG